RLPRPGGRDGGASCAFTAPRIRSATGPTGIGDPGGSGRPCRARHLPQRRKRLLRSAPQGARPPRIDHRHRPRRGDRRGEWVTASGDWVNDRTHGQQFKSRFMRTSAPTSIEGIEKYLGSGMIRGIGPVYAKKMVKAFGEKVFDVIEAEPDRLREVTGIGPMRAKRVT